ncbi:TPA: CCA tRNA nucleotidyltransferase, partial [Streptococcus suis]|nr:CCA tRNA nucleotidyltransferase [Streptococcus suis]
MKLNNLPSEFQEALPILEKIKAAGYEAYFVGGSVRDAILGRPIHDVDIATSSYPQETKQIFSRTIDVGIEHGTVLVLEGKKEYEITTFRTEEEYVDFRRPSQVSFVRSLEEDLKRRDFTVNAFALDEEAQIIDLFEGMTDLENRTLRAVGIPAERFNEDALRIMRGFRFAATLDFEIEPTTFEAMVKTAPLLEKISVERSFIEFDKLLMADFWRKGLRAMIDSKAYNFLPDLAGKSDELETMLTSLTEEFRFSTSEQAWAMLFVCLGIDSIKSFLKKWKTSNDF